MPSESFWNPAPQFRGERTAGVLNSSLGALSDIDNVLSENERQNQRQRRPLFYVDPEDQPSEEALETMMRGIGFATRAETSARDAQYGETRPEPIGRGHIGTGGYALEARKHPIGSPEYWNLVDKQNELNKEYGNNARNDFLRLHDESYSGNPIEIHDYSSTSRTSPTHPLIYREVNGQPITSSSGSRTVTRGRNSGLVRAHMGRSGSTSVADLLADGTPFIGGSHRSQTDTGYSGTYGLFTSAHRNRFGLGTGILHRGVGRNLTRTIEDMMGAGDYTRIGYSYRTPIAFHVLSHVSQDVFGLEEGQEAEDVMGVPSRVVPTRQHSPLGSGHWIMPAANYTPSTSRHQGVFLRGITNYGNRH